MAATTSIQPARRFIKNASERLLKPIQQDPSLVVNCLAWLLNKAIDFGQWITNHGERLLTKYRVIEWLEEFLIYSTRQPLTALILGISVIVCGVPVFVFASFAILSSFITFSGFLFIEGALLTVGFGLLLACLVVLGCITMGLITICAATYLGARRMKSMYDLVAGKSASNTPVVIDTKAD